MVSLYVILDGIKSYIDRCENCPAGREGSCRWLGRFSTPEGGTVWEGLSYEERARKMHRKVGYPPCNQRTFHQVRLELLKTMGEVRCKGLMPKTVTDIRNFLLRVAQTAQGLEDLPEQMRLAFGDVLLSAPASTPSPTLRAPLPNLLLPLMQPLPPATYCTGSVKVRMQLFWL